MFGIHIEWLPSIKIVYLLGYPGRTSCVREICLNEKSHPNTSTGAFDAPHLASDGDLIALVLVIAAVAIWEMDVTASFLHHSFNRQAAFADDMRMVGVTNVQLHGHSIILLKIKLQDWSCIESIYRTCNSICLYCQFFIVISIQLPSIFDSVTPRN